MIGFEVCPLPRGPILALFRCLGRGFRLSRCLFLVMNLELFSTFTSGIPCFGVNEERILLERVKILPVL